MHFIIWVNVPLYQCLNKVFRTKYYNILHIISISHRKPYLEVPPNPNMNIMKYIEKYKNEVIKIGDEFQATIPPFSQENQEDTLIKGNILGTRLIKL